MDRTNLAHWEQLAVLHGTGVDHCHDLEQLVAGASLMGDEEAALVRATAGASANTLEAETSPRGTTEESKDKETS
jgi:hypothetical protein